MGLIGIIGGSGLYQMEGVEITGERRVGTPFGSPSDAVITGILDGKEVAFLPRHGIGHKIPPHKINYRANIFALKELGVDTIISVSAVGSMKENIHPGELVMVDQFMDRTKDRPQTFYEEGIAVHVGFADPVCETLRKALVESARDAKVAVHDGGTYICIEGPAFSSRAESRIYHSWGVDVIGMTNYQEAKLAREAEICFATIALSTDYDCWHHEEGPVDVAMVLETMKNNVVNAKKTISGVIKSYDFSKSCACREALKGAIITDPNAIHDNVKMKLGPIIGKYLKG
jgi:5'-methylthioadenosine phosphorylase